MPVALCCPPELDDKTTNTQQVRQHAARENVSMEEGVGLKVSPLAKEFLVVDRCQGRTRELVFFKGVLSGKSNIFQRMTIHLNVYTQHQWV